MRLYESHKEMYKLFAITTVILIFLSSYVQAGITVDPMKMYFEAEPGENITKTITVENTGTSSTEVSLNLVDWWRTPEGQLQFFSPGSQDNSCGEWLLYSPGSLTIPPKESRDVTVEMQVPTNLTALGDHWAMLLIQESGSTSEGQNQVATRITINYIVKIFFDDPSYKEKTAKITKIEVVEKNPLTLALVVENTSQSYLRAGGTVSIRNLQGETEKEIEVEQFGILPEATREIRVTASEKPSLPTGQYYAIAVMDFGGDHLVQGGLQFETAETVPEDKSEETG